MKSEAERMRSLIETINDVTRDAVTLDEVVIFVPETETKYSLVEGKWLNGTEPYKIRIDHPTHGVGQTHAHIYGRKDKQIGVINLDGSGSHGTKMYLPVTVADALRERGFTIPPDRLVEWTVDAAASFELLFE